MSANSTGLPGTATAASAASTVLAWMVFAPNPPPMYGVITRTRSGDSRNSPTISSRIRFGDCVQSYSVSTSSVHNAAVVCGSIGLLCSIGVV